MLFLYSRKKSRKPQTISTQNLVVSEEQLLYSQASTLPLGHSWATSPPPQENICNMHSYIRTHCCRMKWNLVSLHFEEVLSIVNNCSVGIKVKKYFQRDGKLPQN